MLRSIAYRIPEAVGIGRLFSSINRHKPIVLTFHGVTSEKPGNICNYQGKHLYIKIFSELMRYLRARYTPVTMSRIADWLEGQGDIPERAVAVTFDDGYRNVLVNAAPVLSRLGIPATVYVVTDFVHERKMIWMDRMVSALAITKRTSLTLSSSAQEIRLPIQNIKEKEIADTKIRSVCKALPSEHREKVIRQIIEDLEVDDKQIAEVWRDHDPLQPGDFKTLQDHGIEIGSHTKSHRILSRCSPGELKQEFEDSKKYIESITGKVCDQFAYPNGKQGDFNERTRECARESGYRCAVTTIPKRLTRGQDPFEIPRYTLAHNGMILAEFAAEMSGYPTSLRLVKRTITFQR